MNLAVDTIQQAEAKLEEVGQALLKHQDQLPNDVQMAMLALITTNYKHGTKVPSDEKELISFLFGWHLRGLVENEWITL